MPIATTFPIFASSMLLWRMSVVLQTLGPCIPSNRRCTYWCDVRGFCQELRQLVFLAIYDGSGEWSEMRCPACGSRSFRERRERRRKATAGSATGAASSSTSAVPVP